MRDDELFNSTTTTRGESSTTSDTTIRGSAGGTVGGLIQGAEIDPFECCIVLEGITLYMGLELAHIIEEDLVIIPPPPPPPPPT